MGADRRAADLEFAAGIKSRGYQLLSAVVFVFVRVVGLRHFRKRLVSAK